MKKKTLGILGGVGPLATMYIGEMVVRRTDAVRDQDHLNMVITNNTDIPDRTEFILDRTKADPVPPIIADTKRLATAGAELIVIPCNTAHTFYREIAAASPVPVLNMIEETVTQAEREGARTLGILATDGTIASGVYQDACRRAGMEPVIPESAIQQDVMTVIYDQIKAGRPADPATWERIDRHMAGRGCDRIVLGCTELSVVKRELSLGTRYLDSLRVIAEAAITACGHRLKEE
ncbi:aspartate/glutamate racemase family protein [Bhargavaea cecembensis]|uniref:aspartate/glutamate racemase family protein n=1 Tax=Bhargavaea cecembensis TaxID=394098 RepID=UPI00058F73EE|nr:amino acid racemase [Bhargavaea cecembensis]